MPFAIVEICDRFRKGESRDGGAALSERGEITEDGSSFGSETENPPRGEDLGMQGSDLRSMNPPRSGKRSAEQKEIRIEKIQIHVKENKG